MSAPAATLPPVLTPNSPTAAVASWCVATGLRASVVGRWVWVPYSQLDWKAKDEAERLRALLRAAGFRTSKRRAAFYHDCGIPARKRVTGRLEAIHCADFLACNGDLGTFDRVVMNPPFSNGQDVRHIQHAATFLRPGGVLVALCANGPRQREALQPLADYWEDLPPGTFKEAGTGVNVALLVIRR